METARHRSTWMVVIACAAALSACKPDKPDTMETRRAEAERRAQEARQTAENPTLHVGASAVAPELAALVVARVGDATITLGDVAARIEREPIHHQMRYRSPHKLRELVENMSEIEVMAQEAKRLGLDRTAAVQYAWKAAMAAELMKKAAADQVSMTSITDAEITSHYEAHKRDFTTPERRRAGILSMPDKAKLRKLKAELDEIYAKGPEAALKRFEELAKAHSTDDKTNRLGGEVGFVDESGSDAKGHRKLSGGAARQLYKLEDKMSVGGPVQLRSRDWALIQLRGTRAERVKPIDKVRFEIQNRIFKAKQTKVRDAFIKELRAKVNVEIDEEQLAKLPAPKPPNAPPHLRRAAHDATRLRPIKDRKRELQVPVDPNLSRQEQAKKIRENMERDKAERGMK